MMKIRLMLAAALVCMNGAAFAETRIFLLESTGGYGVDTCLANGEPCGETLASAWCRAHDYTRAIDFGQVTGSIATPNPLRPVASGNTEGRSGCTGTFCPSMVAITCTR
ncbi:MAG: hypothetical protein AB1592_13735 [Pseudomonadota bacterium]